MTDQQDVPNNIENNLWNASFDTSWLQKRGSTKYSKYVESDKWAAR